LTLLQSALLKSVYKGLSVMKVSSFLMWNKKREI